MGSAIRLYFDENVEIAVAEEMRKRGIECLTARDLEALGEPDQDHLARAVRLGCVLCTYDADFLKTAIQGAEHAGIVWAPQNKTSVGDWVKGLS